MDFALSEEQRLLKESVREFLVKECSRTLVKEMEEDERGYPQELWSKMANLGWMGLPFPEKYGGTGGDFSDLVIMLEEMGRVCLPGPFFSSVVLGGYTVLEAGNESQLKDFLPKIANGEALFTLALFEPATSEYEPCLITVRATAEGDDYVVRGTKLFVSFAHRADFIICVARTNGEVLSKTGMTLFLVDATSSGIKSTLLKTIAGDKQHEVIFDEVKVSGKNILGELNEGWPPLERVLQKAVVAKCSEMIGGARQVLDMTTNYAKKRTQFGKPIGSFQAVQHHCANMLIDIEGGRWITYKAAWKLSKGIPCHREVSVAKAWVSEAYKRVVRLGHQVLGGVGYMADHDMPLYSRRAKAAEFAFGNASYHRKRVSQAIGL